MAEGDFGKEEDPSPGGGAAAGDLLRKKAAIEPPLTLKRMDEEPSSSQLDECLLSIGFSECESSVTKVEKYVAEAACFGEVVSCFGGVDDGYDADGDWEGFGDNEIMKQHNFIRDVEAAKCPFVGDKEPLSALEAEYESGSPIIFGKIKLLGEQYSALRRSQGDGNCFFRSFMFSYLEQILEIQDKAEVERITAKVKDCRKTLQELGFSDFTFEDFFGIFLDQLEDVSKEDPISHEVLLHRSRDAMISNYVVMFFRFVTSGEIRKRANFFEPFILGLSNKTVDQFCKTSVEPMGEESDHVHITALSDALGVPIRVAYLDRSASDSGPLSVNHHDFIPTSGTDENGPSEKEPPKPFITLLYRPGHYDILYAK